MLCLTQRVGGGGNFSTVSGGWGGLFFFFFLPIDFAKPPPPPPPPPAINNERSRRIVYCFFFFSLFSLFTFLYGLVPSILACWISVYFLLMYFLNSASASSSSIVLFLRCFLGNSGRVEISQQINNCTHFKIFGLSMFIWSLVEAFWIGRTSHC